MSNNPRDLEKRPNKANEERFERVTNIDADNDERDSLILDDGVGSAAGLGKPILRSGDTDEGSRKATR